MHANNVVVGNIKTAQKNPNKWSGYLTNSTTLMVLGDRCAQAMFSKTFSKRYERWHKHLRVNLEKWGLGLTTFMVSPKGPHIYSYRFSNRQLKLRPYRSWTFRCSYFPRLVICPIPIPELHSPPFRPSFPPQQDFDIWSPIFQTRICSQTTIEIRQLKNTTKFPGTRQRRLCKLTDKSQIKISEHDAVQRNQTMWL